MVLSSKPKRVIAANLNVSELPRAITSQKHSNNIKNLTILSVPKDTAFADK